MGFELVPFDLVLEDCLALNSARSHLPTCLVVVCPNTLNAYCKHAHSTFMLEVKHVHAQMEYTQQLLLLFKSSIEDALGALMVCRPNSYVTLNIFGLKNTHKCMSSEQNDRGCQRCVI